MGRVQDQAACGKSRQPPDYRQPRNGRTRDWFSQRYATTDYGFIVPSHQIYINSDGVVSLTNRNVLSPELDPLDDDDEVI